MGIAQSVAVVEKKRALAWVEATFGDERTITAEALRYRLSEGLDSLREAAPTPRTRSHRFRRHRRRLGRRTRRRRRRGSRRRSAGPGVGIGISVGAGIGIGVGVGVGVGDALRVEPRGPGLGATNASFISQQRLQHGDEDLGCGQLTG